MPGEDLRGKQLKDTYDHIVTIGDDASLGDGKGNAVIIRPANGMVASVNWPVVNDDQVLYIPIDSQLAAHKQSGIALISNLISGGNAGGCQVCYRTGSSNFCEVMSQTSQNAYTAQTGTPVGTTGPDGSINIFAGSDGFYIENRIGYSLNFSANLFGILI